MLSTHKPTPHPPPPPPPQQQPPARQMLGACARSRAHNGCSRCLRARGPPGACVGVPPHARRLTPPPPPCSNLLAFIVMLFLHSGWSMNTQILNPLVIIMLVMASTAMVVGGLPWQPPRPAAPCPALGTPAWGGRDGGGDGAAPAAAVIAVAVGMAAAAAAAAATGAAAATAAGSQAAAGRRSSTPHLRSPPLP